MAQAHTATGIDDVLAQCSAAHREALAAFYPPCGVLGCGDSGRRRLFQSVAVRGRTLGQHGINAGAGVGLGHVFGQSPIAAFCAWWQRALVCKVS